MSAAIDDIREQRRRREEDRYWSLFLALVYSSPLSPKDAAQHAADYYREGTRVMKEITE